MLPFRAGKFFRDFPDFLHRPNGVRELRQRVRPDGAAPFLHRKAGVRELPQAGSPFPGGEFFAEPQRGDSPSADGGNVAAPAAGGQMKEKQTGCEHSGKKKKTRVIKIAAPAAGAKRKDNLRFSFLFELLPFPCFLIWRKSESSDRFEKEYGRGFFLPCLSQPIRRVRYITATHIGGSPQARHKVNCPKGKRRSPGG